MRIFTHLLGYARLYTSIVEKICSRNEIYFLVWIHCRIVICIASVQSTRVQTCVSVLPEPKARATMTEVWISILGPLRCTQLFITRATKIVFFASQTRSFLKKSTIAHRMLLTFVTFSFLSHTFPLLQGTKNNFRFSWLTEFSQFEW